MQNWKANNLWQTWPDQIYHQNPNINPCCFAVFAQEADFLIGINNYNGVRYIKEVASRYKREDDDKVLTFDINDNLWIIPGRQIVENSLFKEADGRSDDTNLNAVRTLIGNTTATTGSLHLRSSEIKKS